jgi:hypothetical protein
LVGYDELGRKVAGDKDVLIPTETRSVQTLRVFPVLNHDERLPLIERESTTNNNRVDLLSPAAPLIGV